MRFDISRGARDLKILLRVDAPENAFNKIGGGDAVEISWGDAPASLHMYSDRQVQSNVVGVTEAGAIEVKSTVDDYTFYLTPPALTDKAVMLSARLFVKGVGVADESRTIILDGRPPKVGPVKLGGKAPIIVGTPSIPLTITVEDLSGVASVKAWVFDKKKIAREELDPKLAIPLEITDSGSFQPGINQTALLATKIPAAKIKVDQYWLVLEVTDRSGQSSQTIDDPLAFKVEEPPQPPPAGPVIGDIKGRVIIGDKTAPAGIKVTLKEPPKLTAKTDESGNFVTVFGMR